MRLLKILSEIKSIPSITPKMIYDLLEKMGHKGWSKEVYEDYNSILKKYNLINGPQVEELDNIQLNSLYKDLNNLYNKHFTKK